MRVFSYINQQIAVCFAVIFNFNYPHWVFPLYLNYYCFPVYSHNKTRFDRKLVKFNDICNLFTNNNNNNNNKVSSDIVGQKHSSLVLYCF